MATCKAKKSLSSRQLVRRCRMAGFSSWRSWLIRLSVRAQPKSPQSYLTWRMPGKTKSFLAGEGISVETIARMLKAAGIDEFLTVNIHSEPSLKQFPFPAKTVSAIPLIADYFVKKGHKGAYALSPDKGAMYIAQQAQTVLGGDAGHLNKTRDRYTGQTVQTAEGLNVKGPNRHNPRRHHQHRRHHRWRSKNPPRTRRKTCLLRMRTRLTHRRRRKTHPGRRRRGNRWHRQRPRKHQQGFVGTAD